MIIEYHRPNTLDEALALLGRPAPVTVALGGGSVLTQQHKPDFAVVDLQNLGLDRLQADEKQVQIGAAATLQKVMDFDGLPAGSANALRKSLEIEASTNIRHKATAAGTLVCCDGRSAFATALLALDARLHWAPRDEVQLVSDFLALRQPFGHERLMLNICLPANARLAFASVARTPLDRPIVCAAVALWPSGRLRVALGGHGATPVLAIDGHEAGGAVLAAREEYHYSEDVWASAAYRSDVAGKLVQRLIAELKPA
jgi:CO/xanthine dehydrogenase FAD-binding subunit